MTGTAATRCNRVSSNSTAEEVLSVVRYRDKMGQPVTMYEALAFDSRIMRRLFENGAVWTEENKFGQAIVRAQPSNGREPKTRPAPTLVDRAAQRQSIRNALSRGEAVLDVALDHRRPVCEIEDEVRGLCAERAQQSEDNDDFASFLPAWRIRDLRSRLREAYDAGKARIGSIDDWGHRAQRREYMKGRSRAVLQALARRAKKSVSRDDQRCRRQKAGTPISRDALPLLQNIAKREARGEPTDARFVAGLVSDEDHFDQLLDLYEAAAVQVIMIRYRAEIILTHAGLRALDRRLGTSHLYFAEQETCHG